MGKSMVKNLLVILALATSARAQNRVQIVQCLNAAGTAIESCAGAGGASASGPTTVTPGTGTWNAGGSSVTVNGSTLAVTGLDSTPLATAANQATLIAKDFGTETTLAAILAKIIAAPATSAKQDTGNTNLSSIDGKTPALGQALAAASSPIVLTAAQMTTLTPPAAITNFANETGGNLATIAAKDFATQTTLSALNAKVTAVNTGAVTISAALPSGTNGIGKLTANSGVDIGDVDVLTLPSVTLNALPTGTNNIGKVSGSTFTLGGGLDGTYALVQSTSAIVMKSAAFSTTVTGTIISAVAGKSIKVYALAYISGAIISVNFRDGASTNLEGAFAHTANSGRAEAVSGPPNYLFKTTAGNSLDVVMTGVGTVAGRISYWEE